MIGIIYAGGQSKRFGQDKALFKVPKLATPNVQIAAENLQAICAKVIVCANEKNQVQIKQRLLSMNNIQVITDLPAFSQHGPLSAIVACTAQFKGTHDFITLAADYPYITSKTLQRLAQKPFSYISTSNHDHYTLAHFSISHEAVMAWLLAENDWRLGDFLIKKCGCRSLDCNTNDEFLNLNYWEVDTNEK